MIDKIIASIDARQAVKSMNESGFMFKTYNSFDPLHRNYVYMKIVVEYTASVTTILVNYIIYTFQCPCSH
jgi:hypothetical protein